MSNWTCKSCGGGFPKPIVESNRPVCPWCSEPIGKPVAAGGLQKKRIIDYYDLLGGEGDE